jgi:peroxiredoxin
LSSAGRGVVPLLIVVSVLAAGAGLLVALRGTPSSPIRMSQPAPGFELPSLADGRSVTLQEMRGRVVFVNFWATWCAPCRTEAPSLDRLYTVLAGEGFELLAISIDASAEAVHSFRDEFDLGFPILMDPEQRSYAAYHVSGVPETFMLDTQGRMVEHFVGPRDWSQPRYANAIRRLIEAGRAGEHGDG